MDEKSITRRDIDKDRTYNRNLWKNREDWNEERTRKFSSIAKKQI